MAKSTQTDIVNTALTELGATQRIQSINDTYGVAPDAKAQWDSVVRSLLAGHPWNWAIRRTLLNASADAPEFGFARAFTLPPDCLRVLPPSRESGEGDCERREEGGAILTDEAAPLKVRYLSSSFGEEVGNWPAYFVRAVELELAARLAEAVTQSATVTDKLDGKSAAALREAKRRDGLASANVTRNQVSTGSDWLAARVRPYDPSRGMR